MTVALIDADIIAYVAGFNAETSIEWVTGSGDWSVTGDLAKAKTEVHHSIESIVAATKACDVVLCFTDDVNFRRSVYPDYKNKRRVASAASRKPMVLAPLKEYMRSEWETVTRPTLEADDCLGILATAGLRKYAGRRLVVASIDKDMMTIPAWHYNWRKPELGVFRVSPFEADMAFYLQILAGDSTDNYPGCPGIGIKRGATILNFTEGPPRQVNKDASYRKVWWDAIVATYAKCRAGSLTEADAIKQARCARILRAEDFDFDTKEVILWTPER